MGKEEAERREKRRACEDWQRISEGVIAGVHHALNNRMAALSAVGQVLEADLPSGHPLAGAMGTELDRLEKTAGLLHLLTGGGEPAPLQAEPVIADAARLFEMHHALRDLPLSVELEEGLYPLWIDPSDLLRAVLVLLAIASAHAQGGSGELRITASGDARYVDLMIASATEAAAAQAGEGPAEAAGILAGIAPESAKELVRPWGGEVTVEEGRNGELRLRLRLPTLPEVRRREKEG